MQRSFVAQSSGETLVLPSLADFTHTLVVRTDTVLVFDVSFTHDTAPAARKCPRTPSLVRIAPGFAAPRCTPTHCAVLPARRCRLRLVVGAEPPWIRRPSSRCVDTSIPTRSRPHTLIPYGSRASFSPDGGRFLHQNFSESGFGQPAPLAVLMLLRSLLRALRTAGDQSAWSPAIVRRQKDTFTTRKFSFKNAICLPGT